LKVKKRRKLFIKVSHGEFHDILPKEYSGTFPELLWGLRKDMLTNHEGQPDIVTHKTNAYLFEY
jgi:hypothetical protein